MNNRTVEELLQAPCQWCGYNGPDYWQEGTHHKDCPWYNIGGMEERNKHLASIFQEYSNMELEPEPEDEELAKLEKLVEEAIKEAEKKFPNPRFQTGNCQSCGMPISIPTEPMSAVFTSPIKCPNCGTEIISQNTI